MLSFPTHAGALESLCHHIKSTGSEALTQNPAAVAVCGNVCHHHTSLYNQEAHTFTCIAGPAATALEAQQQHLEAGGRAIPGSSPAMTSPFSAWAGGTDGESQVNQARMKALGRRKKGHNKAALEVVKEADKEGEEGGSMLHTMHIACCSSACSDRAQHA